MTKGNPLTDGEWMYTWQNGRQLASMANISKRVSFKYNALGLRVQKKEEFLTTPAQDPVVTNYTLHGKNVVHMTQGSNNLHFFYDAQNRPAVVVYNGTAYAYVKNLQGDIIAILDSAGTAVVSYTYDAWGAPTSTTGTMAATLGVLNPFRYRGYVYDEETSLYYLRTRYYDVNLSRFLSADVFLERNLFCYCSNTPVSRLDSIGTSASDARFSVITAGSLGGKPYSSPSERQPNAVLQEDFYGPNTDWIPVSYLLAYLDQMVVSEDWIYVDGESDWKRVDCIGMIRAAIKQYNGWCAENCATYVALMRQNSIKYGYECEPVIGNEHLLVPGMAIYWRDRARKKQWYHIGIYVGEYYDVTTNTYYTDAVIEAASPSRDPITGETIYGKVVARSLADINAGLKGKKSLYFGYMKYVNYSE